MTMKKLLYDVTACDDTKIRRIVLDSVDLETAWLHTREIIYSKPKRLYNPRIRKHKEK